ncbi:MAG: flagellar hook-basal body protein, partial [Sulfurimonas sp.]|nr:flagellar hook-basal body protein [Sulfurimonas sp.]
KRDDLPNENNTKESAAFINRTMTRAPKVVDAFTDHSLGTMQKTANSLDFALSSEGLFFAVQTPQGVKLTRDGSFTKNDEGVLVTKEGYEVLSDEYLKTGDGKISFANQDSIIVVDKNAQISTNLPNSAKLIPTQKLLIAQPKDLSLLKKEGNGLYTFGDIKNITNISDSGALQQGFVEKSNVNAVKMMTQLIETNRLVGMYQKAMSTQMDDMNRDAIEKLARKS